MLYKAGIITLSDKGSRGERRDESGPLIEKILKENGICSVEESIIIPDEKDLLRDNLLRMSDDEKYHLILTTGGTGLSPRDITPEVTLEVGEKNVPGISEYMRVRSFEITPKAMLSRGVSVMRGQTLIINLPGSPKAVRENLEFILPALKHGLDIMTGQSGECGSSETVTQFLHNKNKGEIKAVCISEKKGTAKENIKGAKIIENFGIEGDAHGGIWHRQVSLLSYEKIEEFKKAGAKVSDGSFGENLIVEGINLTGLPIGTLLRVNDVILEVTQIGKECHSKCVIGETMGRCIMPTEGIFAKVIKGGWVEVGDPVVVEK